MLLVAKLDLFVIDTVILPKPKILMVVAINAKIGKNYKIGTHVKINIDEPIFNFPHTPRDW